jgi:hypothetical protein
VRLALSRPSLDASFRVLDSRKDEGRDQFAYFLKRLNTILDAGSLLAGRALIEQEHELGADLLERRSRSGAGPQVEHAWARRDDVEIGGLHRSRRRRAFRAWRVKNCERHGLALKGSQ